MANTPIAAAQARALAHDRPGMGPVLHTNDVSSRSLYNLLFERVLVAKPVTTPDHVRGKLSRNMLKQRSLGLGDILIDVRTRLRGISMRGYLLLLVVSVAIPAAL